MRHYMKDPDNEERLLKIPPYVVAAIKAEAFDAAREAVEKWFAENRDEMTWPEFLAAINALKEKNDD